MKQRKQRKQRKNQSKFPSVIMPVFLLFSMFILTVLGILYFGKNNKIDKNNNSISVNPTQAAQNVKNPIEENKPTENPIKNPTNNSTVTPTEGSKSFEYEDGSTDSSEQDSLTLDAIHKKASEILEQMSLEEKIGQMFFVRHDQKNAISDIKNYKLGGFILFAVDFTNKTKEEFISNIAAYQEVSKIPMLIGVDEEGGTVIRVSKFKTFRSTPFLSPSELYQAGGFDAISEDTKEKASFLLDLGINVNLAPVCDVSIDTNDYIYKRTLGRLAEDTAEYVGTVVKEMKNEKIGSVLKHFPGYGNNVNTHTGISKDNRSYETFLKVDFLPFITGIEAGADSILVSHNIVACMDKDLPASLSTKVHQILREDLNFDGVVMTDDLYMDAITEYTDGEAAAILAVKAGNDLLIASDYKTQIPAVIKAVESGEISVKQIDDSVLRILKWKLTLDLFEENE